MSKNNAKGLTTLRQKLRKYNRTFEDDLAKYREKPDQEEGEAEPEQEEKQEEDAESEDEEVTPTATMFKKTATMKKVTLPKDDMDADDDDSDSDIWDSDSDTESSSDDEITLDTKLGPDIFKKKAPGEQEKKDKERERRRRERRQRRLEEEEEDEDKDGEWTTIKGGAPLTSEKPKMFSKDAEINHDAVRKKLFEIVSARGKKATDRNTQIEMLIELRSISAAHNLGSAMDAKVMFNIVAAIFDYNSNIATCMKPEMWDKCIAYVQELLEKLRENDTILVGSNVAEESESYTGEPPFRVRGCILTVVERLDEEFIKMLQGCDAHSTEYVERLKDERAVCKIIRDLELYMEGRATTEELCRVYLKRIEHIYYKVSFVFLLFVCLWC